MQDGLLSLAICKPMVILQDALEMVFYALLIELDVEQPAP